MLNSNKIAWNLFFFCKKKRKYLFSLFLLISLFFLLLHLTNLEELFDLAQFPVFNSFFSASLFLNSIIVLLFLPSYPLYFLILELNHLNILEKCGFTFVTNLSFYILSGYIGYFIGLPLNSFYFFLSVAIFYVFLILIFILIKLRMIYLGKIKENRDYKEILNYQDFSMKSSLKWFFKTNINSIFLIIFLCLLGFLFLVVFSTFSALDAWHHITLVKIISTNNYLPLENYYGSMGIHIFGVVFHYFSGLDFIFLPKYYIFYSIPLFSVIIYVFVKKVFKNKSIAIFGVFFIESGSVFLIRILNEFWPTSLVICQMMFIFYILYLRVEKLLEKKYVTFRDTKKNMSLYYFIIIMLFISSIFIHSLITMILLITYIWVYLIYFLRDYRRGFDFILLVVLIFVLFIFIFFDFSVGHLSAAFRNILKMGEINIIYYIIVGFVILMHVLIILKFARNIKFGRKTMILNSNKKNMKNQRRIEKKIIMPLVLLIIILINIILFSLNLWIGMINSYIFLAVKLVFITFLAFWGYITFQKSSRGELLYIWLCGSILIFVDVFLLDIFILNWSYWGRILELIMFIIILGFVAYWYKLIKINLIKLRITKIFLVTILIFSIVASFTLIPINTHADKKDIKILEQFARYTSGKKVIFTELGYHNAFNFYDYPYGITNKSEIAEQLHYYELYLDNYYLIPENHIEDNNLNILKEFKENYNTDVYILLTEQLFITPYKRDISQEDFERYYSLEYLNRIYSSKAIYGKDKPLYWVI